MDLSTFINFSVGQNKLTPKQVLSDPVLFLAFGFGSGLAKIAPGTMGTVAAIPIYLLVAQTTSVVYISATLASCILGIWICGITADRLGEHDFSGIVWDEIAGLLVTMSFVPFSWDAVVYGFVLFRLFDIVKPWPISWIDKKITGGFGIMLDDIAAGIVAGGILWWLKQTFV
jgi:phosphatidylglycerophosphatase A